ncbi:MAG: Hsp20/alpha crystallin family protein [Ktedonobacterales bacterium]
MSNAGMSRYSPRNPMPLTDAINQLMREAFMAPLAVTAATALTASMNLYETNDSYILQVPLPGMKPDQVKVTARENMVTIQGVTEFPVPEGARPLVIGTQREEIREQVRLPGDVDAEHASASYDNGILTLRLPKTAQARDRAIQISMGQAQQQQQGQTQQSQTQTQG